MKTIKLALLLIIVSLASCNLDPDHISYTGIAAYITDRSIPETGIVNQPFQITAVGKAYNNCWSNLEINLVTYSNNYFELIAKGDFASFGSCADVEIVTDTLLTITPATAGNYVFTVWKTPYEFERDTVVVSASR